MLCKAAWDVQSADLSDSMNTDHTSKALKQNPESLFSVLRLLLESSVYKERLFSFRPGGTVSHRVSLLKCFFPYKGVQCFSWESWPQYKVDEVTFIFKDAERAF